MMTTDSLNVTASVTAPVSYTVSVGEGQGSVTVRKMPKTFIWVTFQKEGVHRYPAAENDPSLKTGDWDDVSFLGFPHRHIFHFRVEMEVFHDNRDVEFIQLKRQLERWYSDGTLQLDYKSCEMIANDLYNKVEAKWPDRDIRIEVSEDGENGCRVYFERA